jgi:hypothetical protein
MSKYYVGTWVQGYGYYNPIPVPVLPDGYDILPFTYPWVIFCHILILLMGIYPPGTRLMGTHCHPFIGYEHARQ